MRTARHAPPREARPIIRSGATVTLQQPRMSTRGHLEYCTHAQAVAWERIAGCSVREAGDADWRDVHYGVEGIPEVETSFVIRASMLTRAISFALFAPAIADRILTTIRFF